MRNMKIFLMSMPIITLAIISCNKENDEISKTGIVPLKPGNYWTYEVYSNSNHVLDTRILKIGDYVKINGYNCFRYFSGDNSFNETYLVDNDEYGNFLSLGGYSNLDTLVDESIKYMKNANKGDSWDYKEISYVNNSYFDKDDIKMYCINTDTLISTPKGEFNCKVFKWSPDDYNADVFIDYVSENIGVVKYEHYEYNTLETYQLLIDFKIGE